MITKKGLVMICVLSLLLFSAQIVMAENIEYPPTGDERTEENSMIETKEQNQTMEQTGENYMNTWRHRYRTQIQQGVENESVVIECNLSQKAGKMYIHSYEYQKGMTVEIKEQNQHRLEIQVSAEFKEGKILVLNIDESAFKIKNSQELKMKFDGKEMKETEIDKIINGNVTEAKYVAAVGPDGGQYIVYIPHFSEHIITFEILEASASQSMSFIYLTLGAAFLTIMILILIVVRTGRLQRD